MSMKWALYFDGELVKKTAALPTIDQSIPSPMQEGYEWRQIVEDETPDHDPIFETVRVTETKAAGKKLRITKKVWPNPDWKAASQAYVARRLSEHLRVSEPLLRELVTGVVGPETARCRAAVERADALKVAIDAAAVDAAVKPDIRAGWPA